MLPKLKHPQFDVKVPSKNETHKFRPMLSAEEKILLMVKESADDVSIMSTIRQIVNNCSTGSLDVSTLTLFDLEYIFLKLRAFSIDNILKLRLTDEETKETVDFEIDLNTVDVVETEGHTNNIKINENMGIVMKYLTAEQTMYFDNKKYDSPQDLSTDITRLSIDVVYDGDSVYQFSDYSEQEQLEFLDSLPIPVMDEIKKFFATVPKLKHVLEYENSNGTTKTIVLDKITDFFTFR